MPHWQTSRTRIDLSRPQVMGIVNVTPDSFSDGGQHASTRAALAHCEALIAQGADILDIGAESTRPGAQALSQVQELERLLPVLRVAVTLGVPISVDTYKPGVMQAALDVGADIINDIWALRWLDPADGHSGAQVVAQHPGCGVCLMHMHGNPQTMQVSPMEGDIVVPVRDFLAQAAQALVTQGVDTARICIDPGIGFGKTVAQNFSLLARQQELLAPGFALLAGWSRKSSLGAVTGAAADDRVVASAVAAALAVQNGARIVRVHDVQATVQALRVLSATQLAMKN
ncbi:MAG: dihydropteroate synthase [Betaproteobacteria bacterium]